MTLSDLCPEINQNQAKLLYRTLEEILPKKKPFDLAEDVPDHWGLTESSIERQIANIKNLGSNEAIDETLSILKEFMEVEDE